MLACPLGAEYLAKLSIVLDGCLADRVNFVAQPGCADFTQSLIEEFLAKLLRQDCELLNHRKFGAPLGISEQLSQACDDLRVQRLDWNHRVQINDSLKETNAHLLVGIREHR